MIEEHGIDDSWGLVYQVMAWKMREMTPLQSVKTAIGHMCTIVETVVAMMSVMLPDDMEVGESEEHRLKRDCMEVSPVPEHAAEFSVNELDAVVKEPKQEKAPGYDNITADIATRVYSRSRPIMLKTHNELLREGSFPKIWKHCILRILY
ncbi:hypothetical protein PR048_017673 [Dryococelus australis]|uniref:Uncharacterized protein n=1 Tax=Dryococelus australis TaxID=614101 RepID=A0ABQ9HAE5_9NEOP|nr:hypothetical protein PR048_017673 [Dryococelus australis]